MSIIDCPACNQPVLEAHINGHLDSLCKSFLASSSTNASEEGPRSSPAPISQQPASTAPVGSLATTNGGSSSSKHGPGSGFFQTPSAKRQATLSGRPVPVVSGYTQPKLGAKRGYDDGPGHQSPGPHGGEPKVEVRQTTNGAPAKRSKNTRTAPLAERMRPHTLDEVHGQDLVGRAGVLRGLIEADRVPSMLLWGPSGTGKTTIARCIARKTGARFIEMNATSTGVAEVKKMFETAANDNALTGKKTIIFCDEIHRFTKAQQDIFLKPVESGLVTLIGATTENPSFRIQNALLSRCRTFTLSKLTRNDVKTILARALHDSLDEVGAEAEAPSSLEAEAAENGESVTGDDQQKTKSQRESVTDLIDDYMLTYLAEFADGDARTALNLLELALSLALAPGGTTAAAIKAALTKTLVYDRVGDQHYDTISAFHKAVRGSDADAALYYLARMLESGEDPLFIARRMVVIASEDVGLADNTLLPLATAAYTAAQQIGLPEARIPLAHCAVALSLAKKSTRAYRGLNNAMAVLKEPGASGLPIPLHLRNAPTRLMTELGYGVEYKYPPNYVDGHVKQEYLPEAIRGRRFLEDRDLGTEIDPDLSKE
ncbi:ATPase WRNIP1 [Ceratocystis lukuohia]